jgi:response regulator RpfG family c-di-GMP phosphodiesterase
VLIVDDDQYDLESVQRALEPGGYRIFLADSSQAAFIILNKHTIDIVISDFRMPGMSGVQFLAHVRKLHPRALRIAISGAGTTEWVTDAVNEAGIHRYLSKSWDAARLRAEVREVYNSIANIERKATRGM